MSGKFIDVDLVRLSQKALPIAKKYDTDSNHTLDETEYNNFMLEWNKNNPNKSPLLMQLHTKTLSDEALKIAELYDNIDNYKGVLTEDELRKFMNACEDKGLTNVFKPGTSPETVLTGNDKNIEYRGKAYQEKSSGLVSDANARFKLFQNWLKLDNMEFRGSDKYFHAVGNFEAVQCGNEDVVKNICKEQDLDKRSNSKRPENDYTEDLYANFLGREFGKMYPDMDPHDLMSALAPTGFDIDKSKKSAAKIFYDNTKLQDGYATKKIKQYVGYFKVEYIYERFKKEVVETLNFLPFFKNEKYGKND